MTPNEFDPHAPHASAEVVLEKTIFCAACQGPTPHKMSVDKNNEIVATCDCGRAIKMPLFGSTEEMESHLDAHAASNVGQVTVEQAKAERAAFDDRFKKLMGVA